MKVLCYTPSYSRLKMLRSCIQDVKQQTYDNIFHIVNITLDDLSDKDNIIHMFNDINLANLKIIYTENNKRNHTNYINTISAVNYSDYDLFIKIDDDDIYKKDYVSTIVKHFQEVKCDIISSRVKTQLNGSKVRRGNYNNLGGDQRIKMPMTLAFNKIALDKVLKINPHGELSDPLWRKEWIKNDLTFSEVDNSENIIWYIHGANLSTSNFLDTKGIKK